ncbi:MAG: hypothetical protein CFE36_14430 [Sphingomonadaceae bacterium PASS1]|nr:MAG: hypothetical protein CFE36_14430 [Sphingomonadaceae bacterium PASS1]
MSEKRIKTVRLIWLEAFVALAKHRNYKQAGEELGVDPTLINKYVDKLSEWLGRKLVLNYNQSLLFTSDCEYFLPKAETIIDLLYTSREFIINEGNRAEMMPYVHEFFAKHMKDLGKSK